MTDIMLDLETMGSGPMAAIVAIGAVEFDISGKNLVDCEFYRAVDLESSTAAGMVMDASTVTWWLQQNGNAREYITGEGMPLASVLLQFSGWLGMLGEKDELRIWGNGAAFDNVILASAYRLLRQNRPWHYRNDRCYRTVAALHPEIATNRIGTHHNALDDAKSQAEHLLRILSC